MVLAGCGISLWALYDALQDAHAQFRMKENGALRIVANGNIRNELFRVIGWGIFLLIGILALQTPQPVLPEVTLQSQITIYSLLLFAALLLISTICDRWDRIRIQRYLRQQHGAPNPQQL